jgi:predicted transcriptional regulator
MSSTLKDSQVSVRLPNQLKDRMSTYAQLTGRTKSYVAMEALTEYLAWRIPQIDDLRQAVLAAEQGEFATDAQVQAVFAKYGPSKRASTAAKKASARPKR